MRKEKIIILSIVIIVIISLVSLVFLFQEKKCKEDLDCSINNCCNPTSCLLKEDAPACGSITVCNETAPEASCECVDSECVIKTD